MSISTNQQEGKWIEWRLDSIFVNAVKVELNWSSTALNLVESFAVEVIVWSCNLPCEVCSIKFLIEKKNGCFYNICLVNYIAVSFFSLQELWGFHPHCTRQIPLWQKLSIVAERPSLVQGGDYSSYFWKGFQIPPKYFKLKKKTVKNLYSSLFVDYECHVVVIERIDCK